MLHIAPFSIFFTMFLKAVIYTPPSSENEIIVISLNADYGHSLIRRVKSYVEITIKDLTSYNNELNCSILILFIYIGTLHFRRVQNK